MVWMNGKLYMYEASMSHTYGAGRNGKKPCIHKQLNMYFMILQLNYSIKYIICLFGHDGVVMKPMVWNKNKVDRNWAVQEYQKHQDQLTKL